MPSTLANIMDLLSNWSKVVKNNDDVSFLYIVYQVMMLVGTILGPGTFKSKKFLKQNFNYNA